MKQALFRALRFVHPVLDADGQAAGLGLDARKEIACVEGAASIRQALLLLLSTTPGERVMRPTYGCALYRLAFAVNDATTAGLAMHYVRSAVETWEPRVELLRVDAERDDLEGNRLNISIEYRVRRTLQMAELHFPIDLTGEI